MIKLHYYTKSENSHGIGRISFAGIVDNNTLQIGAAVCGKKEQFIRKRGRFIAEGRAEKKPFITLDIGDKDTKEIAKTFIQICQASHIKNNIVEYNIQ